MILVGELSLWVALLVAIWATTVSFAGGALHRDDLIVSGRRAIYATFGMTLLAAIGLWDALLTHDFSLAYVAEKISANMPHVYIFAAFWSGQQGSMLFWALILSGYSTIAIATSQKRNRELAPYAAGTLGAILVFFIATICFKANPFTRLDFVPADGSGMNPQLQSPGMAIHPPNLYLGYVATAIPFSFAVAALITRRLDAEWLAVVRRWSLVSWFFLTIGITLGMWWAYVELGWGGYWAWDPVENVSFLPWLTGTAFLHSIMIQEKRGMLRKWNVVLVVVTFLLAIFGTFLTRSGMVESVHTFAQSPVGVWFGVFFGVVTTATIYLVATRLRDLEAKAELESMVSREAAFLYNNLALCGIAFAVLWGTLFPIISEAVKGSKITVGPPFFNRVNIPLGLLLLALTGIGPLIAWRRASLGNLRRQFTVPVSVGLAVGVILFAGGMRSSLSALVTYVLCGFVAGTIGQEFYKGVGARRSMYGESTVQALLRLIGHNRRRYGGYIVHVGIISLFVGFAGLAFKTTQDVTLKAEQAFEVRDPYGRLWRFVSQGASTTERQNMDVVSVALDTWVDGKHVGFIQPEKRQYLDSQRNPLFAPANAVAIRSTPQLDTYLVLAGVSGDDNAASITVDFNPLVMWVWIGGFIMMIGGLIVMWPQAERRRPQSGYAAVMAPASDSRELVSVG